MNEPGHAPALLIVLVTGLVLWRLYSRFRRNVGRQLFTPGRARVYLVLCPLLAASLVFGAQMQPLALAALGGGIAAGVALGVYGLKVTRFEAAPEGLYYTPSSPIGIALSMVVIARIIYRFFVAPSYGTPNELSGPPAVPALTMLAVGPILGYYATYNMGLLRWRTSVLENKSAVTQPPV